ncbi:uncharacterized protein BHQ10_001673 [Talaromyces amestolkiae]|uniref:Uncharacterized protein n=1 Tax=Talaromyces amestolkiae TaxID=1196081 RepID=A0A364KQ74_TALAM|nr:uncharacterized protein BHQ10_001673 [Talaromyces amestolkiae]RAO65661.1 hypothetical protein BHQ10_001673 [Talaromyces amestolkiae]
MNPTFLPGNSLDLYCNASENDPNGFFDDLFTANGDLTGLEASFGSDRLPGISWDDYHLITEDQLPEGAPYFDMPAGNGPGFSNINTSGAPPTFNVTAGSADIRSGAPSTFNSGAESALANTTIGSPIHTQNAGINVSGSLPMSNLAASGALSPFDFTAGSANVNMPIDLQTPIEQSSFQGFSYGAFLDGTNGGAYMLNGGWVSTCQQARQPIGIHAPLALPNTHLKISSSPNTPPTTPQRRPSLAAMPDTYSKNSSNTSSETLSPPKRSQPSSPRARRRPKRRKGAEDTLVFVHDKLSMSTDFYPNPDNHGRFEYSTTAGWRYLNAPGAAEKRREERQRHQEGN